MLSFDLIVDGVNVFNAYGIGIEHNGYNELIAFNSLREPKSNNWLEEDGIEYDLSDPKLHSINLTVSFVGTKEYGVENFINLLDESQYHTFNFSNIGLTRQLRLTSMPDRKTIQPYKVFQLQFTDDSDPFLNYVRQEPVNLEVTQTGYEIDNKPLSYYGIFVGYGTYDSILIQPDTKQALIIDNDTLNGSIYDNLADVVFGTRDVSIKCTLRCDVNTFWRNWNVFYYDLTRPNERSFYWAERNHEYPCFYKSCKVDRFYMDRESNIWCDFTLTLHFTNMNIGDVYHLLDVVPQGFIVLDSSGKMIDTTINGSNPS